MASIPMKGGPACTTASKSATSPSPSHPPNTLVHHGAGARATANETPQPSQTAAHACMHAPKRARKKGANRRPLDAQAGKRLLSAPHNTKHQTAATIPVHTRRNCTRLGAHSSDSAEGRGRPMRSPCKPVDGRARRRLDAECGGATSMHAGQGTPSMYCAVQAVRMQACWACAPPGAPKEGKPTAATRPCICPRNRKPAVAPTASHKTATGAQLYKSSHEAGEHINALFSDE